MKRKAEKESNTGHKIYTASEAFITVERRTTKKEGNFVYRNSEQTRRGEEQGLDPVI